MKDIIKIFRIKKTPRPEDPVITARNEKRAAFANRFSVMITMIACVSGYFLIEAMARHSVAAAAAYAANRTIVFFFNALLIYVTTLPVYLFRKRYFYRVFISVFWLGLGAANGIVLANRVTPLTGPDFGMIKETIGVIGAYFSKWEIILFGAAILAVLIALIRFFFTSPVYRGKMHRKTALVILIASTAAFGGLTYLMLQAKQLSNYFSNIAFAYLDYGFPYSLSVTIFDQGISEPRGYSEKLVQNVLKEEGELPESTVTDDMPNIIVVQLESFFDPTRVRWLRMSEDPVPNWHRLAEEYSSGFYRVPTVGAGTVNTEFETLTGMSLRFFGAGEYPYKGILLKEPCESAAYNLASIGYTAHALHNNTAEFYGRNEVYKNLGFNSFTSEEYMNTQYDVNENGWMRDRNLTSYIMDAIGNTSNRDFIFTVSVQAHGAYPTEPSGGRQPITVTGAATDEKNCSWAYYVNQIAEVDKFVGDLTEALSTLDEPAIVLFYGDHLPTLGLTDRDMRQGTTFDTNYIIWSNFELERKVRKLPAYQAVAELLNRVELHIGTMFRFNQSMRNKEDYFYNMQILQYDILYGDRYVYGMSRPYSPSVLAMGEKPVRVGQILHAQGSDTYYVIGENFTQSCVFRVNGEDAETVYVDKETLAVRGVELNKGDWVTVAVKSNEAGGSMLSTSNTLVYGVGRLTDAEKKAESSLVAEDMKITAPDPDAVFTEP